MSEMVSALVVTGRDTDSDQLGKTLASIRAQTYAHSAIQLIVVGQGIDADRVGNDAEVLSSDAPSEGAGMNRVTQVAEGAIYFWSDGATLWHPQRVEHTLRFLDEHPDTDVCLCPLTCAHGEGTDLGLWDRYGERIGMFLADPCPLGSIAMRRSVAELFKRCREIDLARWELLMRCSLTGRAIGRIQTPLGERLTPSEPRLPAIVAGRPACGFVKEHLDDMRPRELFAHATLRSVCDAYCVKAALLEFHDFVMEGLAAAAEASRIGCTDNGLYWQGVLYRRLADLETSQGCFARLGSHPVLVALRSAAIDLLADHADPDLLHLHQATSAADEWNPLGFLDLCRKCARGTASDEAVQVARRIQAAEFDLMLHHTYRAALGQP